MIGDYANKEEHDLIIQYTEADLPPVSSVNALAAMTGFNPGFIWSIIKRPRRHYRSFALPKGDGKGVRQIYAPKVGLKAIQSWLGGRWSSVYKAHESVHGFIPGRSHITAAQVHLGAQWVISTDIVNFFPSIEIERVKLALQSLGYRSGDGLDALGSLLCLDGALTQGAPTSPVVSNVAFAGLDRTLSQLSKKYSARYTRYADDLVFSGKGEIPLDFRGEILAAVEKDGWTVSEEKTHSIQAPKRLKVHGLLVHGQSVRLTKGYRNRIRAYRHLLERRKIVDQDLRSVLGHIAYADQVDKLATL